MIVAAAAAWLAVVASSAWAEEPLAGRAREAMDRAAGFFASIATGGGYAGIYSLDLRQRYGESLGEKAKDTQIWVQPPGTPSVGRAFLRAYRLTKDGRYLSAARAAGRALVWGQRQEGGWDHLVDVGHLKPDSAVPDRAKGRCTFDDAISQGALEFLMDLDETLDEPWLDDGIRLGLEFMLKSQFPNGAWPQWFPLRGGYYDCYTFNDNAINDCIRVLLDAHRRYGKAEFLAAAERGGEFIVLSQLPAPQSGWAQQYSYDLKPAWARAFEPPGVCSAVTARNIRTLVDLYVYTGREKYLAPIPAALEWLERSQLKDNLWARLYEVGTNRPIYGDRDGKVHYMLDEISDERRTGYSWQSDYGVAGAKARYEEARTQGAEACRAQRGWAPSAASLARRARGLEARVRRVVDALDDQGRWVTEGRLEARTFVANMEVLCDYLEAATAP